MKKLFTILAVCFTVVALNAQTTRVILSADNVWGDGSGYQMLLDPTASLFGTVIPETGALTETGDADPSVYAQFGYTIPENADGSCSSQNVVMANSVGIDIPAGTYD